jgi:hypothetical protein
VPVGVELDGPPGQDAVLAGHHAHLGTTQVGPDPRDELAHGEGLGDVVVGAELEPGHLVGLGVLGGEDQDRHVRLAPDRPTYVEARQLGEHEVEDHDARAIGPEPIEGAFAVGRGDDREPLAEQVVGDALGQRRLVLHEQDLRGGGDRRDAHHAAALTSAGDARRR